MVLDEDFTTKLPDSHDTMLKAEDTDKKKAVIANQCVMMVLSITLKWVENIAKMYKTMRPEWPAGLASKVIKLLRAKYQSNDRRACVDRLIELAKIKMRVGQDPDVLSEHITMINNKYVAWLGSLDEGDSVAVVVRKAPVEYQAELAAEQHLKGEAVMMDNFIAVMNLYYWGSWVANKDNIIVPDETVQDEVLLLTLEAMKCFH